MRYWIRICHHVAKTAIVDGEGSIGEDKEKSVNRHYLLDL